MSHVKRDSGGHGASCQGRKLSVRPVNAAGSSEPKSVNSDETQKVDGKVGWWDVEGMDTRWHQERRVGRLTQGFGRYLICLRPEIVTRQEANLRHYY